MASASPKVIGLEEGWEQEIKVKAIDVLEEILNSGLDSTKKTFPPKAYMQIYTTCYNMCTQRSPYNWSEQLYQRHGETIQTYLNGTVLPALKDQVRRAALAFWPRRSATQRGGRREGGGREDGGGGGRERSARSLARARARARALAPSVPGAC
jgi:hypothetical protein